MNSILNWLDSRTGIGSFWKRCASSEISGGPCVCRSLASVVGLLVLVQLITGAILFMYYSAGAQTAWESVYFLQNEVCGGWFLRAVHHYTAQTLLAVIGLYIVALVLRGAVRAPREFVFWTLVTMGLLMLGLLFDRRPFGMGPEQPVGDQSANQLLDALARGRRAVTEIGRWRS